MIPEEHDWSSPSEPMRMKVSQTSSLKVLMGQKNHGLRVCLFIWEAVVGHFFQPLAYTEPCQWSDRHRTWRGLWFCKSYEVHVQRCTCIHQSANLRHPSARELRIIVWSSVLMFPSRLIYYSSTANSFDTMELDVVFMVKGTQVRHQFPDTLKDYTCVTRCFVVKMRFQSICLYMYTGWSQEYRRVRNVGGRRSTGGDGAKK